ncbi:GNAT family N-acetyltransferase [Zobellia amurskyensis]|uniref:GNAT family N-acetyltransferase n=1 Tax=Zobellia amurskyensis TaxID=248905 RepID=A0A7X3D422_9FLAO|nr:GNAT family N-acetyltransferase [Zobellia amurskyensis]MUH37911.1 GNAT family N-acetyltransferase [Zobellia amurskyensis]
MKGDLKLELIPYDEMESILPLIFELNQGKLSKEVLKSRLQSMLAMGGYQCLGVYDNQKLIACCGVWLLQKLYKGKHLELDNVFVNEEYRSKGVGNLMMDWLSEYGKSMDCASLECNCYLHNEKGIKFWQRHGFEPLGYHMIKNLE